MSELHSTIEGSTLASPVCWEETWRDIPGFPDYQASNLGRVRSRKWGTWKVLRPTEHSRTGYLVVSLRVDGRYIARSVHRLIAATYLGEAAGRDVNHKNGDKQDNTIANLEYLSRGDNHRHAYRTGFLDKIERAGYLLRSINYESEVVPVGSDTILARPQEHWTLWLSK